MRKIELFSIVLIIPALLTACIPSNEGNRLFSIGLRTYAVALGDLDGDGDLDAYLANGENEVPVPNTVWLNDGRGNFSDSNLQIGERESWYVVLADIELDGDLDAVSGDVSNLSTYGNDGSGVFGNTGPHLFQQDGGSYVLSPAAGDLNGDGYPDFIAGGCCGGEEIFDDGKRIVYPPTDSLWLNDGKGKFTDSSQTFDHFGTTSIALGDLDGDGDHDAFFGNSASNMDQSEEFIRNQPDTIWINDGLGNFSDSGQRLGEAEATSVALGDLDSDGDLDAFVGNGRQEDEIWLNSGGAQDGVPGSFIRGGTVGDAERTRSVALADLNGDGHLDALTVYRSPHGFLSELRDGDGYLDVLARYRDNGQIWFNDGSARFTEGQVLTFEPQHALALGDLNGDRHVDVFAGSVNHGILVWFNDGAGKFTQQ